MKRTCAEGHVRESKNEYNVDLRIVAFAYFLQILV